MKKFIAFSMLAATISTTALAASPLSSKNFIIDNETGKTLSYIVAPQSSDFPKDGIPAMASQTPIVVNITTSTGMDWMKISDKQGDTCTVVFSSGGSDITVSSSNPMALSCSSNGILLTIKDRL